MICAGVLGFFAAAVLILTPALPPLLAPPEDVHRVSAAMFTISYSCAVITPVLSGLAWDLTGIAQSAFVPLGLCAVLLITIAPSIRLRHAVELRRCIRNYRWASAVFLTDAASAPLELLRRAIMLGWALTFLIVALIAAVLGFGGIAGLSVEIAKIIFFVAIGVFFLISAIVGLFRGRTPTV